MASKLSPFLKKTCALLFFLTTFSGINLTSIKAMPLLVPSASVSPASFNLSLPCGSSSNQTLTISNTGSPALNFSLIANGNGNPDTAILVIQDAASWTLYMSTFFYNAFGLVPDVINSTQISTTNLSMYDAIVTVGSQSTAYYNALNTNLPLFTNFVNNGGIMVFQNGMQSGSPIVTIPGGAQINYGGTETNNTGVLFSHPLLTGMSNPITGNAASHGYITSLPAGAQVIVTQSSNTNPTVVEYNLGSGKVIATSMPWEHQYQYPALTANPLLLNCWNYVFDQLNAFGSSWITPNITSGSVAAGSSTNINLLINAAGLNAGVYTATIIISTNDPAHPNIAVPVTLTVTGNAAINLSAPCVNFGSVQQFSTHTDSLMVSNPGCDTLHITAANFSIPGYSFSALPIHIAPGDSQNVYITFSPQTSGPFNGNLLLVNNVSTTTVCLTASAGAAPAISVNPSPINYTLNCNDSTLVPVYISNTGGSDLNYTIAGNISSGAPTQVLALTYGVDMAGEYPNTVASINQYFTNYVITQLNTTDPAVLQTALAGKNIILFPEQESGTSTHYTNFAPVVQNFVNSGGTVIICGSSNASSSIYNLGLFTGTYQTYTSTGNYDINDTTDFLVKGINLLSSPMQNATFYHSITNPDKVMVCDYLGYDVATYRFIGGGKAIFIGFDYYGFNPASQRIISNAIKNSSAGWIGFGQTSGLVPPGGTDTVYVSLNSLNLLNGNYSTQIIINSNDPVTPNYNLTVNLTVSGTPEVSFSSNCLNFGTLTQFTSAQDTLTIYNSGCDTLNVTAATPGLGAYTVSGLPLNIPSGGSANLIVTFNPQTIGTFNTNMLVINNDVNTNICLTGAAGAAPQISVNPASVTYTLNCNDSAQVPITITNTGGSDLNYNVNQNSGSGSTGTVQVLAFMEGVDTGTEYPNMINGINQYFSNYNITQTSVTTASSLQAALVGKDVLLFPENESGSSTYFAAIAPVIQSFANAGGTVIVCGNGNVTSQVYSLGLFTGSYVAYVTSGTLNIPDTTNYLVRGINSFTMGATDATYYHLFTNPNKVQVVTYNGNDVVSYRDIGQGRVVFIAFDYYATNNQTNRIIANAIKNNTTAWLSAGPVNATITPGNSDTVYFNLNSIGLTSGTYLDSVLITSNDPLNPSVYVPVTLLVNGDPQIQLSQNCLLFGQIQQFNSVTDTLIISNSGCDSLVINSLFTNNPQFTVSSSATAIQSGDSAQVYVTFTPTGTSPVNASLFIQNSDVDTVICLNGTSFAAPVIDLPASLSAVATACSDSVIIPFYIHNAGGGNLQWSSNGSYGGNPRILSMMYGVDSVQEYSNTIASINQYFTNYTLSTTHATTAAALQPLLQNADILLFPEQETLTSTHYAGLAPVVQNFVNNGGTVILCLGYASSNRPMDLGLFTASSVLSVFTSGSLDINIPTNYLVNNITTSTISAADATQPINFTNADKMEVVSYLGNDIVTYRNIGQGRAIYIGFDYYAFNPDLQKIIANAVSNSNTLNNSSGINLIPSSGNTVGGDSTLAYLVVNTDSLNPGLNTEYFYIYSNDPLHPVDSVLVSINVSNLPCPAYNYQVTSQCSGNVNFVDQTSNSPTSWQWNFGDGGTSNLSNPSHIYAAPGNYLVKLIVCNAFGCDSVTQNIQIFSVSGPVPPSCTPATTSYCCGMGIAQVILNGISNSSNNASVGYENFSCSSTTTLIVGNTYSLTVDLASAYNENIAAWIDFNNNGTFDLPSETVLTAVNVNTTTTATFTVPLTAVLNTPIRLRIGDDYYINPAPQPCVNVLNGQFEDYAVVIIPNNQPPQAAYSFNITDSCNLIVQFTDQSTQGASSYLWNFGDGTTSTLANPSHQYSGSGTYIVWQYVTNAFGTDSISQFITLSSFTPSFTVTGVLNTASPINFNCLASGGTSFLWLFGDGMQSTQQNDVHSYTNPGTYYVSLTVNNGSCSVTLYDTLVITSVVGIMQADNFTGLKAYPNPFNDLIQLSFNLNAGSEISLSAYDLTGREIAVFEKNVAKPAGKYIYTFKPEASGIYMIQLIVNGKPSLLKTIKVH